MPSGGSLRNARLMVRSSATGWETSLISIPRLGKAPARPQETLSFRRPRTPGHDARVHNVVRRCSATASPPLTAGGDGMSSWSICPTGSRSRAPAPLPAGSARCSREVCCHPGIAGIFKMPNLVVVRRRSADSSWHSCDFGSKPCASPNGAVNRGGLT